MMKKNVLLLFILILFGCSINNNDWTIPIETISNVEIVDHRFEAITLTQDQATRIIESFNKIEDKSLNQEFNDGEAVFGKDSYTVKVTTKENEVVIGVSDYGLLNLQKYENEKLIESVYYDVDLFHEFFDITREYAQTYNLFIANYVGNCGEDSYMKVPFSKYNDYLVGGQMKVKNLYESLEISCNVDDLTINDYLKMQTSDITMNKIIEIENVKYKILNTENSEVNTVFVRIKD